MAHIEICNKRWFDAGSDASEKDYAVKSMYSARQKMMAAITNIGEKSSVSDLEKALSSIIVDQLFFDGSLYIEGKHVAVSTPAMPMACYVGKVIE